MLLVKKYSRLLKNQSEGVQKGIFSIIHVCAEIDEGIARVLLVLGNSTIKNIYVNFISVYFYALNIIIIFNIMLEGNRILNHDASKHHALSLNYSIVILLLKYHNFYHLPLNYKKSRIFIQ